jgi:hypothetical protein
MQVVQVSRWGAQVVHVNQGAWRGGHEVAWCIVDGGSGVGGGRVDSLGLRQESAGGCRPSGGGREGGA